MDKATYDQLVELMAQHLVKEWGDDPDQWEDELDGFHGDIHKRAIELGEKLTAESGVTTE